MGAFLFGPAVSLQRWLEKGLKHPVGAFVKIDVGAGRSGILWDDTAAIDQLVQRLAHSPKVQFKGFLTHAGHSYKSRDRSTVQTIYQQTSTRLQALKDRHQSNWPHLILSAGDTPCFSQLDHFVELDEIRPGNFVFYDLMQEQIGSCTFDDIALVLACPVVARHAHRQELVLYGGAVHFSKEYILRADGSKNFGRLAEWTEGGWSPLPEDNYLRAVSQEHGLLKVTPSVFSQLSVGSVVPILPIHSCLSANLMPHYHALDGQRISK
ncbi:MAG: alanine racemase [Bacteroidota bacterium]